MRTRASITMWVLTAVGCASAGNPSETAPVPVYLSWDDVPCEYEVVGTVSGSARVRSPAEHDRERNRVLGHAAAEAGADAVVVLGNQPEPGRGAVGVPVARPVGAPARTEMQFLGLAIRYVDGACGG